MKNYLDNPGLGTLWGLIKAKFAAATHTHKAADITDLTQIGKAGTRWKQNPAYDATQSYVPRAERKEWSAVGLLGVLSVCDDGTCQPGTYCTVTDKGLATAATTGYRVLRRVSETVVEVLFR